MTEQSLQHLISKEGLHVLHLFYTIDQGQWQLFTQEEQIAAKTRLASLVQEIRATEQTQLLLFSIVSPKADLGFMLMTPDLLQASSFEKRLSLALGADVLSPAFSFFSMTEQSEYVSSDQDYAQGLISEKDPSSMEFTTEMIKYRARAEQYRRDKLNPALPNWPICCFYPMSRRRSGEDNWYGLPFAERKQLMAKHSRVIGQWKDRVVQLLTGSSGLDCMEWGVTLFAKDSADIKAAVYELRFDSVGAKYTDCGDCFVGLQLPLNEIYRSLQL